MSRQENSSFYKLVSQDIQYQSAIQFAAQVKIDNLKNIENLLRFSLRPYQLEALNAFELFWKDGFDSRSLKQKTIQKVTEDNGKIFEWPKIGFEMATGSGKTLLMGAIILYLWHKGHRDFLILTPNTILFDKTIENFTPRAIKSIFGDGWNLTYNLVTGNSYRDKTCHYQRERDVSFYVFNMQKFYDKGSNSDKNAENTMKGVPYVRRPIEESLWKDEGEKHTISFIEFLRERRPVIISDEAHHYQQARTKEAIHELLPSMVVEFTATSIEKGGISDAGQDNLYKYPIQKYIGEGYGKRIFALGCGVIDEKLVDEVTGSDKQKLIWGMLVHLLKRESLKAVDAPIKKAMVLVKARTIKHADNIDSYLRNWSTNVTTELNDVLEQLNREQTDVVKIIRKYLPHQKKDLTKLTKQLEEVAKSVFTIHSENKNDEEVWTDYKTLDDNDAEIVNQVKVFTEGVDYDNFYTIVVLGDTVENVGLVAAQLIGRGLRLYKERREYDILDCDIKEQSEILHVICERGKRFDKIVGDIRKNMELSEGVIETPAEEEEKPNKVRVQLIDDYKLPILRIRPIATGITFEQALKDKKLSVDAFMSYACGISKGEKILKPEVMALIEEAEITKEEFQHQEEKPKTSRRTLVLSDEDAEKWAWRFIEETESFIGNSARVFILERIKEIAKAGIQVETAYAQDYRKALRALEKSIRQFYRDRAYEIMFNKKFAFREISVKEFVQDSTIIIRNWPGWTNLKPAYEPLSGHMQSKGVVIEGYKYSARPYVKIDSLPEKWVADALEQLCLADKTGKSFWVRNEPKTGYAVEVKPAPFYPDFIAFIKGEWAIIDVKGRHLAEAKQIEERKKALKLIQEEKKIKTFFLVDDVIERKGFVFQKISSLDDLGGYDELRNAKLSKKEYVNGQAADLFDKSL
jgi:type III restriction enzyme